MVRFPAGEKKNFFFPKRPDWLSCSFIFSGLFPLGLKRPGSKADSLPTCGVEKDRVDCNAKSACGVEKVRVDCNAKSARGVEKVRVDCNAKSECGVEKVRVDCNAKPALLHNPPCYAKYKLNLQLISKQF